MLRKILAGIAGLATAVLTIFLIERLGHTIYPPPTGIDFSDAEAMRAYTDNASAMELLFPAIAWVVATIIGGSVATAIARQSPFVFAAIVGGLILFGTIMNLVMIPHPLWFSIVSVAAVVAAILFTARFAARFVTPLPGEADAGE